jgi:hypothetical protein
VIRRAHTILDHLEATHQEKAIATTVAAPPRPAARPAPAPDAAPRPQSPESVLSDDQLQLSLFS